MNRILRINIHKILPRFNYSLQRGDSCGYIFRRLQFKHRNVLEAHWLVIDLNHSNNSIQYFQILMRELDQHNHDHKSRILKIFQS